MISLKQIKEFYPEHLRVFNRFMLREYLQYKILEIIFESEYANKLSFLGGTCLRIVYDNSRFSEDLDFDNFNLLPVDFKNITSIVKRELERLGYSVEMRNVEKGAFHCYIRFPELLHKEGLSSHKEEKILIQLDTESHQFHYKADQPIINKFDVFTQINSTPKPLLLAQKFYAIINRKRNKGRDFFDLVFLLGQNVIPNYNYLSLKININTAEDLRKLVVEKCSSLDMQEMANDVKPFLFNPKEEKKVALFIEYIKQVALD